MLRFFFHSHAGRAYFVDPVGTELPDIVAARIEAALYAAELLRDNPQLVCQLTDMSVSVTDDLGSLLFAVRISGIGPPPSESFEDVAEGAAAPMVMAAC